MKSVKVAEAPVVMVWLPEADLQPWRLSVRVAQIKEELRSTEVLVLRSESEYLAVLTMSLCKSTK